VHGEGFGGIAEGKRMRMKAANRLESSYSPTPSAHFPGSHFARACVIILSYNAHGVIAM
jgi:hypothetical protein